MALPSIGSLLGGAAGGLAAYGRGRIEAEERRREQERLNRQAALQEALFGLRFSDAKRRAALGEERAAIARTLAELRRERLEFERDKAEREKARGGITPSEQRIRARETREDRRNEALGLARAFVVQNPDANLRDITAAILDRYFPNIKTDEAQGIAAEAAVARRTPVGRVPARGTTRVQSQRPMTRAELEAAVRAKLLRTPPP